MSEPAHEELHAIGREISAIAASHPDRPAVVSRGSILTFGELDRQSDALACRLVDAGLEVGDRVALLSRNRPEWIVAYWAGLRAGVTIVPINWHLESDDVRYVIDDSGSLAVIAEEAFARQVDGLDDRVVLRVAIGGAIAGFIPWSEATRDTASAPMRERGSQMIYTSGTTGRPKGVRGATQSSSAGAATAKGMLAMFDMQSDRGDSMLAPAPLYHSGPSRLCCEWPLGAGVTVHLMDRFDAQEALELIDRNAITHAFFVPTMFRRMLAVPERDRFDVSSLRFVLHGAGPCTADTKQAMFDWFGPVIHEMYAASEGPGTWITPHEWLAHPGSVGRVDPDRLQIRRDDGSVAEAGEVGQVWFRSVSGFRYHGDPDKTAAAHDASGEWYTVGDFAHVDADSYLFLAGRSAECIVSGGVNLYPARVDEALASAPGIVDGAAFGLPDEDLGEVVAVAVIADGSLSGDALADAVLEHCRSRIGAQLTPKRVFVVDELPCSDAGKLYRGRLVERFRSS